MAAALLRAVSNANCGVILEFARDGRDADEFDWRSGQERVSVESTL
jgi:hypothetical protein